MSAFATAIDALFDDPNMCVDGIYTAQGQAAVAVRVIETSADVQSDWNGAQLHSAARLFDVRVSEIGDPRPGDTIRVGGEDRVVQGEPVRDTQRLVWTLDTVAT